MNTAHLTILKKPLMTEKASMLTAENNQVAFEVSMCANRSQIKRAVEKIFNVKVERVRTMIARGKTKTYRFRKTKRPNWKKAYVTLKEGSKIELFQGV